MHSSTGSGGEDHHADTMVREGVGLRLNIRVIVAAVAVRKDHDATCVHVTHGWAAVGACSARAGRVGARSIQKLHACNKCYQTNGGQRVP